MIMTRAIGDRILKDANGDIGDHLRNHIHLTNCIHLKNHIHKHSPLSHDSNLMRDLIALQRSRSLRDPSASPPPWHSPLTTNVAPKSTEIVGSTGRRRSMGTEHVRDRRRLSGSSPPVQEFIETSKLGPREMDALTHVVRLANEHNGKSVSLDNTRVKKKESVGGVSSLHGERSRRNENGIQLTQGSTSGLPDQRGKKKGPVKGKQNQESFSKTLSEQLNEVGEDSSGDKGAASSNAHLHGRLNKHEMVFDQPEPSFRGSCTGLHRARRRKFRRIKRTQPSAAPRGSRTQNSLSVTSNSSVCAMGHQNHQIQDRECEFAEHDVTGAPKNGCGIPWNWSIIHHRGKSFIDMAGRSLSCGLSDPRLKREGSAAQARDAHDLPAASDRSSSGSKSDAEALPLLVEGFGSHETSENAAWEHDYSGELGIFADSLLKRDMGSDLASEGRSGGLQKQRRDHRGKHQSHRGMHQSLTQKYMPRTFRDLVGQNLVVQALSNAVVQRKVGFLYVFYGPHGTGKTSCARILARALNCQSSDHPKPCGFCSSCVAHDMGKSRNIKEVGPVCNLNFASTMDFLDGMMVSQQGSHYRVFIFDDCDNLSPECWSSISKVIDRAPRRVVFMLICSSLDVLPHIIISRCQKFFFPKLKDADIIYALQWISRKENLEIDKDAMKLIASRSDGSLRDAEMTLEQLSLLGQRISVTLVQELVGLISDEKLVDLLDLALSADTVNTVKCLREIMETGVEPLALMSQLATVITDILAGSYDFSKDRRRRKFFKHQASAKEDMEKLRHALKTLSEAEKQLRMSNDKLTWLTAALLQLAPDGQYIVTSSSTETSFKRSPLALNNNLGKDIPRKSNVSHGSVPYGKSSSITADVISHPVMATVADVDRGNRRNSFGQSRMETEDIWLEALEQIQIGCIKDFLYQEGKLMSVSYGVAPTVKLMFSSSQTKSKAEKFKEYILQAFESTLGCPVIIEIRSNSRKDVAGPSAPLILPSSEDISSSQLNVNPNSIPSSWVPILEHDSTRMTQSGLRDGTSEIVEVTSSPKDQKFIRSNGQIDKRGMEIVRINEAGPSNRRPQTASQLESRRSREQNQCQSIVRSKVSLAHVIQQAEGRSNRSAWTKRKAVSIAEKLEQENLRLEPKSRSLLCWKASRSTRRKISHLKVRSRRTRSVLKFVSCGRCLRVKSPR